MAAFTAFGLLPLSQAQAQEVYPSKAIRLVVPNPPGASLDVIARGIGKPLSEALKQSVVVDNRPGAGTMLGADYVAKAPADGYTIMLTSMSYTTSAAIYPNLPFDPINDLVGITMIGKGPWLLVVSPSLPVNSIKELIAFAKASPGKLNYGSAGNGVVNHLWMELFKTQTKTDIVHVPYKGASPAINDVIGGRVQMFLGSLPSVWPHVKASRLRALVVTTTEHSSFVPTLPTIAEATGVRGLELEQWWGTFASARTPRNVINKLDAEIRKILATPDMKAWLANQGAEPAPISSEQFSSVFRAEIVKWRGVIATSAIKADGLE